MTDEQRKRIHAITYSTDDRAELAERIVRIEDENAKLRELARDMWPHVRHRTRTCLSCDLGEECAASEEPCLLYEPMERRMRELGIEASDE